MMVMTIIVVILYIVVAYFESRNLIKNKYWPELISSMVLLTFGFTLIVLQTLDVKIPSPGNGIKIFVENVMHLGYK
ncbi:MAG: hypothetical protein AB7C97_01015 [Oscillospiraceae bacterium]